MSESILVLSAATNSLDDHRRIVEDEIGVKLSKVRDTEDLLYQSPLGFQSFLSLYGDSDFLDDGDIKLSQFPTAASIDTHDIDEAVDVAHRLARRFANQFRCKSIIVHNYGLLLAIYDGNLQT
jgi:hypothetical protein